MHRRAGRPAPVSYIKDFFLNARKASLRIAEIELRKSVLMTPRSRSGSFIAAGTTLDPMRHIDEAMDIETDFSEELESLNAVIEEAYVIVAGVEALWYDDAAEYLMRYYLIGDTRRDVARALGCTVEQLDQMDAQTFEWCERTGWAALKEAGSR